LKTCLWQIVKGKYLVLHQARIKKDRKIQESLRDLNLGLEDKLHVKVGTLSGGQRQAVALIMATMTPIEFLI
jgi:putative ABC transport system ATP-binding protein